MNNSEMPSIAPEWRTLISIALDPDAGYIELGHGSYNRRESKCTGCGEYGDEWDEQTIQHGPNCSYVAQLEATSKLTQSIVSAPRQKTADEIRSGIAECVEGHFSYDGRSVEQQQLIQQIVTFIKQVEFTC
jgi:hypothetical protein